MQDLGQHGRLWPMMTNVPPNAMCATLSAGTPPQRNSTALVQRLLDANGVVMGKTRCHELVRP
jgi:Asp-tRNA(Asn)/Glu-tRNA(Gln) amidotransferase A subunit family amidase